MAKTDLTAERLRELLDYNPETGIFIRRVASTNAKAGARSGCTRKDGYVVVRVENRLYLSHRLAWLYTTGVWPTNKIDHVDGNPSNNSISNLRDVCDFVNAQNIRKATAKNKSGILGASAHKNSWSAVIGVNGVRHRLGTYSTPELANEAYLDAKRRLHPGCTI